MDRFQRAHIQAVLTLTKLEATQAVVLFGRQLDLSYKSLRKKEGSCNIL